MIIFDSESDLVNTLQKQFYVVADFAEGRIPYDEFDQMYDSFYYSYALDGHESDEEEKLLLQKYSDKIDFYEKLSSILSGVCSDEDSLKEIYINAGRYSSEVAKLKIKQLVNSYKTLYCESKHVV